MDITNEFSKWQDQNGQDRYIKEIKANNMQILSGLGYSEPQPPQSPFNDKPKTTIETADKPTGNGHSEIDDDDIPF